MPQQDPDSQLMVLPIGGVGEFGANATIVQSPLATIAIDFGLMFSVDKSIPGVDYWIHDVDLLLEDFPELEALVITHGHEDHIGGVSFLLEKCALPIYTLPYTARLLRTKLGKMEKRAEIHEIQLGQGFEIQDITLEFIGVTHSIAQATAVCIEAAGNRVIHSGDFKVDPLPEDHYPFDSKRLRDLGQAGVDLLIMDSTNSGKRGFCPSEEEIMPELERIISQAKGRVFFTTFASHMPRFRRLIQVARACGRRIALVGNSFRKHYQVSLDVGYMDWQAGDLLDPKAADDLPDNEVMFVITGSQGERGAALNRVNDGSFMGLRIKAGDTVLFSSRTIPGNERMVALLASDLERKGALVYTGHSHNIHTSGHGYREDLAYMLHLTQPCHVVPIHGEFHQILGHMQWLKSLVKEQQQVHLIEDGDALLLCRGNLDIRQGPKPSLTPIDNNQMLPMTNEDIRTRKKLMYSGMAIINAHTDRRAIRYEAQTVGMLEKQHGHIARVLIRNLKQADISPDQPQLADAILRSAKRVLSSIYNGKPIIALVLNGRLMGTNQRQDWEKRNA